MEKAGGIQRSMIIGLCGFIGSGKNTVAEQLGSSYRSNDGSPLFVPVSFAGVLKDAVAATFGWDRDMLEGVTEEDRKEREKVDEWWAERLSLPKFSPRWALQYIGTDVMRKHFHPDIWVFAAERRLLDYKGKKDVVISDVRFPNEMEMIRNNGGEIWWIKRDLPEWYDIATEMPERMSHLYPYVHQTEYIWCSEKFDCVIENDGDLDTLDSAVDNALVSRYKGL